MASFELKFEVDNMAFGDGVNPEQRNIEVARILRELAKKLDSDYPPYDNYKPVRDINGNSVGYARFKE